MNLPVIIKFVIDLLAVLLLALGIKGLSKVKSARDANRLAAFAMSLSVVGLLSYYLGTSGIATPPFFKFEATSTGLIVREA